MQLQDGRRDAGTPMAVGIGAFLVMMSGNTSQSLLFSLLPPLLPAMARSLGGNGALLAQMMFAMASLGLMIASIASGLVVQAAGVRRTLVLAGGLYGVSGTLPAFTDAAAPLLASRLLLGGACGLLTTASMLLLAHGCEGDARNRMIGYQTAIGSVAGVGALLLGGATVARLGWHPAFLVYGLFAIPVVLLAILGVPPVPLPPRPAGDGLGRVLARLWPVYLVAGLLMMVALLTASDIPFILTAIGATAPLLQSVVIAMSTIFVVVGAALFGRMQLRLGARRTFSVALLCAACGMALVGLASGAPVVGVGCALIGLGIGLYIPHLWVLATTLVPEDLRGHAIGLLTTAMYLGGFLYPFLIRELQAALGLAGALRLVAVALAAGAAGILASGSTRLVGPAATRR